LELALTKKENKNEKKKNHSFNSKVDEKKAVREEDNMKHFVG